MDLLPVLSADNNYRERIVLNGVAYRFMVRWNSRDNVDPTTGIAKGSWYLDIYEDNLKPIATSLKVVLGTILGSEQSYLPFFQEHIIQAIDTTGSRKDAGFNDLGARVQLVHLTWDEFRRNV